MIPVLLVLIPFIGSLVAFFTKGNIVKYLAIVATLFTLIMTIVGQFYFYNAIGTPYLDFKHTFFGVNGFNFIWSYSDLGIPLLWLTNIVYLLVILFLEVPQGKRAPMFYGLLLLIQTGLNGLFLSHDILWFYIFFEMGLVPAYLLIAMWSNEEKAATSSFNFFIYTLLGSLLMLGAIIYLIVQTGTIHATDFSNIFSYSSKLDIHMQKQLALLFLFAFMIKMPMFPFHTWQPAAYKAAPTSVTIILSALMAKMGIYGIMRIVIQAFPAAFVWLQSPIIILAIIGLIYTAIIAIRQDDLKKLLAYSSISHMALMVAGVFSYTLSGYQGVGLQMFNHGIIITGLLVCVHYIYKRCNTYSISELGGIAQKAPKLAVFFLVFLMASIALPLTNGFVGEFLILRSIYTYSIWMAIAAGSTIIFGAVYMLRMYQYVMYGNTNQITENIKDLDIYEILILVPLMLIVIILGVYPNLFLNTMF
jgi:NADH-quinone oxidoreductase subunit M